jgi:hypothetical protein
MRKLETKCGAISSCFLEHDNGNKVSLVSMETVEVEPGEYTVKCTTMGGMCLMEFVDLATQACLDTTYDYGCNHQSVCTDWTSAAGNKFQLGECETKDIKVKGKIWIGNEQCDFEKYFINGKGSTSESCTSMLSPSRLDPLTIDMPPEVLSPTRLQPPMISPPPENSCPFSSREGKLMECFTKNSSPEKSYQIFSTKHAENGKCKPKCIEESKIKQLAAEFPDKYVCACNI